MIVKINEIQTGNVAAALEGVDFNGIRYSWIFSEV